MAKSVPPKYSPHENQRCQRLKDAFRNFINRNWVWFLPESRPDAMARRAGHLPRENRPVWTAISCFFAFGLRQPTQATSGKYKAMEGIRHVVGKSTCGRNHFRAAAWLGETRLCAHRPWVTSQMRNIRIQCLTPVIKNQIRNQKKSAFVPSFYSDVRIPAALPLGERPTATSYGVYGLDLRSPFFCLGKDIQGFVWLLCWWTWGLGQNCHTILFTCFDRLARDLLSAPVMICFTKLPTVDFRGEWIGKPWPFQPICHPKTLDARNSLELQCAGGSLKYVGSS